MGRIGLLGGTFDPPHFGHLWLAQNARDTLQLDQVVFLPVGQPPHKPERSGAGAEHRLAMVRLATQGEASFEVSEIDLWRPPPHYTATLLPLLRARYEDARMWLLIGSDSLRDLHTWHRPQDILVSCALAVLPRPNTAVNWVRLSALLPEIDRRVTFLPGPALDIAGRSLRARLAAGASVRYLVPDAVEAHIRQHCLYGADKPAAP